MRLLRRAIQLTVEARMKADAGSATQKALQALESQLEDLRIERRTHLKIGGRLIPLEDELIQDILACPDCNECLVGVVCEDMRGELVDAGQECCVKHGADLLHWVHPVIADQTMP